MIEDGIQDARELGEFDNLPGKGRPLNLTQDPLLDPLTAIVHRILRENCVLHPLIEARKTIEADQQQIRSELARAWGVYRHSHSEEAWQEALRTFRAQVKDLNRQIRIFTLKTPSPALHGLALDAEREIKKTTQ